MFNVHVQPVAGTGNDRGEEINRAEASRGMCCIIVTLALPHHVPVEEKTHKGALLGDAGATEMFGSLKAVLGKIPAVYAYREVRSHPLSQNFPDKIIFNRDPSL